ncbi:hypothetical protein M407DRAFT_33123 [Tulasnella calospora MUT 4182]|uniref:NADAR domain-containing protein n=1 Tax=Tulasnella calospora MUT 4182 TaxID=1051891 RepID=A0A0C3PRF5_9AGAM|nr:hypothetical protein M407DRAFT_33123 [Tulasnella calospora MUT 4182]
MTHVANPPPNCPICHASGSGRALQGGYSHSVTTAQNPTSAHNADPFQDQADAALALVDPRRQTAGGFRPAGQPVGTSGRPQAPKAFTPRNIDPLAGSDDEGGYATPSDIALPDSPVVETTSGSDSAVLVNYSGVSRSDTMKSAPPAYDDTEWTQVEVPSGRSSPAKDQTLRSPVYQKKLPDIPPRRKGLFGQIRTSSKTPASSGTTGQESDNSSSTWKTPGGESSAVKAGPLGRPQNSSHPALSPSAQPDAPSFPVFPSAPTNALGISEGTDSAGKPLVIADPKAGGESEAFSNQDPLPIEYKKKTYPSGEHLYHAMKFMDTRPLLAEHIRECTDPKEEAARFFFERNPGWDQMRVQKMEEVVQLKCKQHSTFKDKLRETGDTHIYFNDPDPFWGTGPDGSGQNQFGEVLMRVRATLGKGRLTRSLGLK